MSIAARLFHRAWFRLYTEERASAGWTPEQGSSDSLDCVQSPVDNRGAGVRGRHRQRLQNAPPACRV